MKRIVVALLLATLLALLAGCGSKPAPAAATPAPQKQAAASSPHQGRRGRG